MGRKEQVLAKYAHDMLRKQIFKGKNTSLLYRTLSGHFKGSLIECST